MASQAGELIQGRSGRRRLAASLLQAGQVQVPVGHHVGFHRERPSNQLDRPHQVVLGRVQIVPLKVDQAKPDMDQIDWSCHRQLCLKAMVQFISRMVAANFALMPP